MKKYKSILLITLVFVLSISLNLKPREIRAEELDTYRISTNDLALHVSQPYNPRYSFDALIVTKSDGSVERKNYDEFIDLGGSYTTTVPDYHIEGEYFTTFSLNGQQELGRVLIIEDDITVDYRLNDIDQLAHKPLNIDDTFHEVILTLNGVETTISTLEDFKQVGGTVDASQLPSPLKAGVYPVVYTLHNQQATAFISVTSYRISTHDLALFESQVHNPKHSFDALEITHHDMTVERKSYEEFLSMGGTVDSTIPYPQVPGTYDAIYTFEEVSEKAKILVLEDDVTVEFSLNEVFVLAHESLQMADTFQEVTVTINGESESYYTLEEFKEAGGTIDDSELPSPLKAGRYPITYSIHGENSTVYVNITEYNLEINENVFDSVDDYNEQKPFGSLKITNPDLSVESVDYENFINMGGMASTHQVDETHYTTTYTLGTFSQSVDIRLDLPVLVEITLDYGYDSLEEIVSIKQGTILEEPKVEGRPGYIFKGWFTDNGSFNNRYDFNQVVDSDIHLYAKWDKENEVADEGDWNQNPSDNSVIPNESKTPNDSENLSESPLDSKIPNTGINTNVFMFIISMMISGYALTLVIRTKKQSN